MSKMGEISKISSFLGMSMAPLWHQRLGLRRFRVLQWTCEPRPWRSLSEIDLHWDKMILKYNEIQWNTMKYINKMRVRMKKNKNTQTHIQTHIQTHSHCILRIAIVTSARTLESALPRSEVEEVEANPKGMDNRSQNWPWLSWLLSTSAWFCLVG